LLYWGIPIVYSRYEKERLMKILKISDETHAWLLNEKVVTGVPMATQVSRFIKKNERQADNDQENDLLRNVKTSKMAKETA